MRLPNSDRGAPPAAEDVLERGRLRLNLKRMEAHWAEQQVELTLTEFWIVHALAKFRSGRAAGRRRRAGARTTQAQPQAHGSALGGAAGGTDADGILDRACACQIQIGARRRPPKTCWSADDSGSTSSAWKRTGRSSRWN